MKSFIAGLFLVLAGQTLASASLICQTTAVPLTVRSEGVTEQVGDHFRVRAVASKLS